MEKFEQIVRKIEPRGKLLRTWQLTGGVSAQTTAVEIETPDGETKKMVVRRHGVRDLEHNPHVAADEFRLLKILKVAGLATPEPYLVDESGEIFATPYIVVEYIEGRPDPAPSDLTNFILQLATQLVKIHAVDGSDFDLSFLSEKMDTVAKILRERPGTLDDSMDEGRIRGTLESVAPLAHLNKSVLLHGDYWQGNTPWKEGLLVGVIDWEDAELGDPLADVANCRLEILWGFGEQAKNDFTSQYQALTTIDLENLPYWDLVAALRPAGKIAGWGLGESTKKKMLLAHKFFVDQAIEKVTGM